MALKIPITFTFTGCSTSSGATEMGEKEQTILHQWLLCVSSAPFRPRISICIIRFHHRIPSPQIFTCVVFVIKLLSHRIYFSKLTPTFSILILGIIWLCLSFSWDWKDGEFWCSDYIDYNYFLASLHYITAVFTTDTLRKSVLDFPLFWEFNPVNILKVHLFIL